MNTKDWLENNTIYMANHGSRAYGTSVPTSDHDLRGVAVPPKEILLGSLHSFEQAEQKGDPDIVVFSIRKFLNLAADCNPNVLEILFVADEDVVKQTPSGELLVQNRELFLSKKARHTFSGYAVSQLKRIESHRRWLLEPPKAPPIRADFDLPERMIIPKDQLLAAQSLMRKKVDSWELDIEPLDEASKIQFKDKLSENLAEMNLASDDSQIVAAGKRLGYDDNFLELLDRERRYNTAQRQWDSYSTWLSSRNPARAEIEARYGYDTKHGMHLVRLMRMCKEILTTGKLIVRRPDAEELLSIRNGAWTYEKLIEWAKKEDTELESIYKASKLPHSPDRNAINDLCVKIVEKTLSSKIS